MSTNAFGYKRPKWGLHYCPWDEYCRKHQDEDIVPWLYVHMPWGSLIIPLTLNRNNWPYGGWWLKRRK